MTAATDAGECRFCNIVNGEISSWTVYEDEWTVAFLDTRPLFPGHTLLVPRLHVETLPELPAELVAPLFSAARTLAKTVQEAVGADGSFVAMNNRISQSVPHLHIHIVPRKQHDGLRGFFWPRQKYESEAEAKRIAAEIRKSLQHERGGR